MKQTTRILALFLFTILLLKTGLAQDASSGAIISNDGLNTATLPDNSTGLNATMDNSTLAIDGTNGTDNGTIDDPSTVLINEIDSTGFITDAPNITVPLTAQTNLCEENFYQQCTPMIRTCYCREMIPAQPQPVPLASDDQGNLQSAPASVSDNDPQVSGTYTLESPDGSVREVNYTGDVTNDTDVPANLPPDVPLGNISDTSTYIIAPINSTNRCDLPFYRYCRWTRNCSCVPVAVPVQYIPLNNNSSLANLTNVTDNNTLPLPVSTTIDNGNTISNSINEPDGSETAGATTTEPVGTGETGVSNGGQDAGQTLDSTGNANGFGNGGGDNLNNNGDRRNDNNIPPSGMGGDSSDNSGGNANLDNSMNQAAAILGNLNNNAPAVDIGSTGNSNGGNNGNGPRNGP